jgi:hypothetical protein
MSILKDVLSREATMHKTTINSSFGTQSQMTTSWSICSSCTRMHTEISDESVIETLRLLAPKLTEQIELASKMQLLEPLQQLQAVEGTDAPLTSEFRDILGTRVCVA